MWRIACGGLAVVTGVLMLLPAAPAPVPAGSDKLSHFLLFAANGMLALRAFPPHQNAALWVLLLYGTALELAQTVIPGRTPSSLDALANAAGIAAAAAVARVGRARAEPGPRDAGR